VAWKREQTRGLKLRCGGYKGWATIFVWVGANAITLYFLNGMISFETFAARFGGRR